MDNMEAMELLLDGLDVEARQDAFDMLLEQASSGVIPLPPLGSDFNLHCHSIYSFNGYGHSPMGLAWRGRRLGLCAMALVDFDVLDGVDEFLFACQSLGLRSGAGLETRVFVPEFAEDEINSPGEPGVAYQVGIGFVSGKARNAALLSQLKAVAQHRTRTVVERVNGLLSAVALDYAEDVLALTPTGNPTERHVCAAYDAKARTLFGEGEALQRYWSEILGLDAATAANALAQPPAFQGILRAKTMKSGGVGYVQAKGDEFPLLEDVNRFVLDNGAIPTFAFLDGDSSGEKRMDDLLDVMTASGVAAVNIIPDRNWNIANPDVKARKTAQLDEFIARAEQRFLPIIVGTEMNAHGQRFVDDFNAAPLRKHFPVFQRGMYILYAHTTLQSHAGMGYLSPWAQDSFATVEKKNRFYAEFGRRLEPVGGCNLEGIGPESDPERLLDALAAGR